MGNSLPPTKGQNLGSKTDTFYGDSTADLVTTGGGADYIQAFGGDDYIVVSGLVGTGDKNPFDGRSNYALVDTGTGSDIVEINTDFDGAVKLISGGGDDKLVLSGDANFYEWSTVGNDLILKNSDATITLQNQLITAVKTFSHI